MHIFLPRNRPAFIVGLTGLAAAMLGPATVLAQSGEITAAAMGSVYDYNSLQGREVPPGSGKGPSSGDTWYSCWGADDTLFVAHDDGYGFGWGVPGTARYLHGPVKPDWDGIVPWVNHGLCKVVGDPNLATESVRGINLNPGIFGYTLPATYSRGLYEVDGVLYAVKVYSNQRDKDFDRIHYDFFHGSLMKSTDGGRNWYNNLGQLNTGPPNNREQCMFPDPKMSWAAFVHYSRGGVAPAIDNAEKYVYLASADRFGGRAKYGESRGGYLARIPRATMAHLDKNDIQYFRGGSGMEEENWSKHVDNARLIVELPFICPKIVYNYALQRYLMCDEFIGGLTLFTARHPWGPWTRLVSHRLPGDYWGSLACNKWTTADGKKMWYIATGGYLGKLYPYGFMFNAVYLSQGTVDAYEAAGARRTAAIALNRDPATGEEYATGFAKPGDGLSFTLGKVHGKGWHIVRFQYTPPQASRAIASAFSSTAAR